ncbi:Rrf2 family transcriptional regulator [Bacteriovoracaceae bacterium]|nr:Rrf2 family transcriptional regulator [Bacteriovoracaceae bacterium]
MIKISKKIEYSLIALQHIHQKNDGELTTARELVQKFDIPFDTTSKVLQQLNSSKILSSIQGSKGGYFLDKELASISYMELCRVIEKKSFYLDCGPCTISDNCNITATVINLNSAAIDFFESLSLEQLLDYPQLINKTSNINQIGAHE